MRCLLNGLVRFSFVIFFAQVAIAEDITQEPTADEAKAVAKTEAQLPETVVTANRIPTQIENVGRSIDVRTEQSFKDQQDQTVVSALQDVPGVRALSLGGPGSPGTSPLEIRGFRTGGTLLLLDGMKLSDPSSVSGTYEQFFSFLNTSDLQSIEVMRGGAGVLYGSEGQSGVVNLIPKTPSHGVSGEFSFEGGSYDTYSETAFGNFGSDRGGVVASLSRDDSNGLNTHSDYDNTTLYLGGQYDVVPGLLKLSPIFRLIDAGTDLDTDPTVSESGEIIPNQDTEKNRVDASGYILGITSSYTPSSAYENRVRVYYNDVDRDFFFDFSGFESRSEFIGKSFNTEMENIFKLADLNSEIVLGLNYEHQKSRTNNDDVIDDDSRDQYSIYLYDRTGFFDDILQLAGGARVTDISNIDKTISTLEASAVVKVPVTDSRIHTSIAQGFRAPTLFETDGDIVDFNTGELVAVGNDNLDVEEALSWDAGVEQQFLDQVLRADATFFQTDADQTIVYDYLNNTHYNGGGGKTQGVETSLLVIPNELYTLRGAYTYLDRAEIDSNTRRPRTPKNWFALTNVFKYEALTLSAKIRFRDEQEVRFFGVANPVKEDGVTVVDLTANYDVTKNVELFLRAENIFDEDYTEAGYQMPGASGYAGVRLKL